MKRLQIWIVLLVTTPACSAASKPATPMECEHAIIEAEQTANIQQFEQLLANDIVAIGPDGKRHSKAEMLQILKTIPAQQVSASDFM